MINHKIEVFNNFLEQQLKDCENSIDTVILKSVDSYDLLKAPLHVSWEITSECNFRCIHCRAYEEDDVQVKKGLFTFDEYRRVIDILKKYEIYSLGITGGEPFLHPNIKEIIKECKIAGFKLTIYTNGSLITNDIAEWLKNVLDNDDIVHVSFDGGTEYENDLQRGKGAFNKTLKGIEILGKKYIPFRLTIVPTINNIKNIENIIYIAYKYGAKEVSAVPLMEVGRARNKNLSVDPDFLFEKEVKVIELAKKMHIKYSGGIFGPVCKYRHINGIVQGKAVKNKISNDTRICDAGTRQIYIDSVGDVFPCHLFSKDKAFLMGNIYKNDFSTIWNNPQIIKFKIGIDMSSTKCRNCAEWSICNGGCMGLAWNYYKNLNKPDPRCTESE